MRFLISCVFLVVLSSAVASSPDTDEGTEGCVSYRVTHVYGSKGVSTYENGGEECCQKGDTGESGLPGTGQKGEKGNSAAVVQARNYWTRSTTGCSCHFNRTRTDCACCYPFNCPCNETFRHECVPCDRVDLCRTNVITTERREFPKSCEFIDSERSGTFLISPNPVEVQPFYVYCNFTSGRGVTVVRHNSAMEQQATNCEPDRCGVHPIQYNADIRQIAALTDISATCRQFVRYRCIGGVLFQDNRAYSAWTSRDNVDQHYWGGSNTTYHCACGETGSCVDPATNCNCDDNLLTEKADEGYLTDKSILPVSAVKFGDLGDPREFGFYTIGFLECSGRA